MLYVVGSGPAGVSCAHALLDKGYEVTMLDAGVVLDFEKQKLLSVMGKSETWSREMVQKVKCELDVGAKDGPYKLSYGSDYPYRSVQEHMSIESRGALCRPSFAKGGLSNVWGAAVLPYIDEDIVDWPIRIKELGKYYEKVLSFMHIAAGEIELADRFPLYTKDIQKYEPSKQASLLLKKFRKNRQKLYARGFRFGSSRLAVRFDKGKNANGCVYCGLCLYGCPNQLIYSAAMTVDVLRKNEKFKYVPNVVVERVEEGAQGVRVIAHDRTTNVAQTFEGDRVFIGAGAIPTAKIVLASLKKFDVPVVFKDSQQFLVPCLTYGGVKDVVNQRLHTLCQLYIEILDGSIDKRHVHAQVYTYNDVFEKWLQKRFGFLYKVFKIPFTFLMGHMVVLKVFVHSDSSGSIEVSLTKGPLEKLVVTGKPVKLKLLLGKILLKFFRNHAVLGMVPLLPLVKSSKPGGANHYGGGFPMSKSPVNLESDVFGRPGGLKRVHLVDSSVLPSIASQTVTFTVMANAYRIASEFDKQ